MYRVLIDGALSGGTQAASGTFVPSLSVALNRNTAFLQPNSSSNPNIIRYQAVDAFGLTGSVGQQQLDVVVLPQYLTSVTWNAAAHGYDLGFNHDVVDYHKTISQILGLDIPVVGSKDNRFLINLNAAGSASLNPNTPISLPVASHILIKALDGTIYDKSFNGSGSPTDHLTLKTSLVVNSRSLDVTAAAISLQLQNLNLIHVQTPLIKLFSFGLPGVASIDAGVRFGFSGDLSAGLKVGLNPNVLVDPLHAPVRLGLMSPSFIQPSVTGNATVEGDVDVLGFDVASLEGTVGLTLQVTAGLDNNDPSKVFSFDSFFSNLAVKVDAILSIHLEADVFAIGDVWDYDSAHTFPVADTSHFGIITSDPAGSAAVAGVSTQVAQILKNPAGLLSSLPPDELPPDPVIRGGASLVGAYKLNPSPQIVIDPNTGTALTTQVVNVSTVAGSTVGNLQFSQRVDGAWSARRFSPAPIWPTRCSR